MLLLHHGHDHGEHDHGHEHGHDHDHEHAKPLAPKEAVALMNYLAEHNANHVAELREFAGRLEASDNAPAADLLRDAITHFEDGCEALKQAQALVSC